MAARLRNNPDNLSLGSFGRLCRSGLGVLTSSSQGSLGCPDHVPHASSLLSNMEDLRQQEKLCDIWLEVCPVFMIFHFRSNGKLIIYSVELHDAIE